MVGGGYEFVSKVVVEAERSEPLMMVDGRLLAGEKPAEIGIPRRTSGERYGSEFRRRE